MSNEINCALMAEEEKDYISHIILTGYSGQPCLVVLQVGDNPASNIYVRNKRIACDECNINCEVLHLPESTTTDQLIARVRKLNADFAVDGIMIQMPLPSHIDADKVIDMIDPDKDVDGLTPLRQGELFKYGTSKFIPCTAQGVMELLRFSNVELNGADAVVIGRSELAGMPIARLLTAANATVTLCHSHTKDVAKYTRTADIVVVAVGKPDFLTADMISPDTVVVDVGINRVNGKTVGDCHSSIADKARLYTPVPGGVGKMTVAMLMRNTLAAMEGRLCR